MGLHTALLPRRDAGRVQPRQTGPGYTILEIARCSDGRWHEIDSFGRKLATVADLLDADDLVDALRSTDVDAEDEGETSRRSNVVEETVQEIVEQVERPRSSTFRRDGHRGCGENTGRVRRGCTRSRRFAG